MKYRSLLLMAALALLSLSVGACGVLNVGGLNAANAGSTRPTTAKIGDLAPEISLTSLTGDQIVLSRLEGRPVIVNFWATWCGPCREEFPTLVRKYKQYQEKDLVIVGVNYQDNDATDENVLTFM